MVVHGLGDSLESYVEVGDVLNRRGHTVLLLDLRAHGGSDGRLTTLGGHERRDVLSALSALRARGLGAEGFVLFGVSMGGVTVIRAAADDDVRAVIAEAPFDTYRATIVHHARLYYGLPEWFPLIPAAIRVAEWRAGFDADEVDAVAAAAAMRVPLLLIPGRPGSPDARARRAPGARGAPGTEANVGGGGGAAQRGAQRLRLLGDDPRLPGGGRGLSLETSTPHELSLPHVS